jgi:hypothetical protein
VYFDNKPCQVCGSEVRLEAHDASDPRTEPDPDRTTDLRICTNPDCATHQEGETREP